MTPEEIKALVAEAVAAVKADAAPVAQEVKTTADKAWENVKAFFSPITSLFTARTLWFAAALAGLGLLIGWNDIRLFGLSALWAVLGIVVAYHARKWLIPEVKLAEWYELAKGGNIAAALVICSVHVVQCACILIVALSALKAGV